MSSIDTDLPRTSVQRGRPRAKTNIQSPNLLGHDYSSNTYKHGRAASELGSSTLQHRATSSTQPLQSLSLQIEDSTSDSHSAEGSHSNSKQQLPRDPEDGIHVINFESDRSENVHSASKSTLGCNHEQDDHDDIANRFTHYSQFPEIQFRADAKDPGVTFDDLVQRLLAQPMSKADFKFTSIFLCLYRKFAAPAQLMSAIIRRFEGLNEDGKPQMIRISSQLRYLNILAHWVGEYPGDFAHAMTRKHISYFVAQLASNRVFSVTAKEMEAHLDVVCTDDDTDWACSDSNRGRTSTMESFLSISSRTSATTSIAGLSGADDVNDINYQSTDADASAHPTRHSATSSTSSSLGKSGSQSTTSFQTLLNSVELAQKQSQLLTPLYRTSLTKIQWHQFMDISDEEIARELTRIDWIMFSAIRPRDLVRHVSLSTDQKQKCRSLEHVDRMIQHFNHVAFWVANFILLRDKPKHRAKALEKYMGIAWVSI